MLERLEQLLAAWAAHQGVAADVVLEAAHHLNNLVGAALLQDVAHLGDLMQGVRV